jgi:hypothetical protein
MTKVLLSFIVLLTASSTVFAQAVNPARTYEQQRNSQPPADGSWHVYDRNGNLQKEENYKNYRLNGQVKTFSPTGGTKSITFYVDGNREGVERVYYDNGALQFENNYKNNDLNGISKEYYLTGELKRSANYVTGQLNDVTKLYYENGALKQQWNYDHGIIHGTQLSYGEDGQVKSEDDYQNGVLVAHKDYTQEISAMTSPSKPNKGAPAPGNGDDKKSTAYPGPQGSAPADNARKSM